MGMYTNNNICNDMDSKDCMKDSPADTYIEFQFEEKCKYLSNGYDIITEWRKRKQQYVKLLQTVAFDFQHYSRHDQSHSVSILEAVEMLLGKQRIELLSCGDLWLLLETAYNHDTGMVLDYNEVTELWEKDDEFHKFIRRCMDSDFEDVSSAAKYYREADRLLRKKKIIQQLSDGESIQYGKDWPMVLQRYVLLLVTEYIRIQHTKRVSIVQSKLDQQNETNIPQRLYKVGVAVSCTHGQDFQAILENLKYSAKAFGCHQLHPRFAAAMLRIGDLLDIENNRFDYYTMNHFGRLPLASMLHVKKHEAVTHIDISETAIEAEADTDEYEVALLTAEWFEAIDQEVNNLICHWSELAPEKLKGCTLGKSSCKVFLRGQIFNAQMKREFSINKKKLIRLLIGTTIYGTDMEFLREYLQNAMDASKMQFWLDLSRGKYDSQRNTHINDYQALSPFDLSEAVYENYPIKLKVEWNAAGDNIRLEISDCGIGIEKEYFHVLSNIGTGWHGRKNYAGELDKMASWLYPTGGFGIGIQSAFMVTDEVEIVTKSESEITGYRIVMKSPHKGGSISTEIVQGYLPRGTTVIIELKPEKFQDWMRNLKTVGQKLQGNRWTDLLSDRKYSFEFDKWDEFNANANLMYVQNFLKYYIETIIPDPLFPIEITCPVSAPEHYKSPYWPQTNTWVKTAEYVTEMERGGKKYLCYWVKKQKAEDSCFQVWERTQGFFCVIKCRKKKDDEGAKYFCFKNVLVRDADIDGLELFRGYDILLDFMGFHAEQCLKIHRNDFIEDFQAEDFCRECFQIYMSFLQQKRDKMGSGTIEYAWNSYDLQLLRMLVFDPNYDIPGELPEKIVGSFQNDGFQIAGEKENKYLKKVDKEQSAKERLEMLNLIFHSLKMREHAPSEDCFFLMREDSIQVDTSYHPNVLQDWIRNQLKDQQKKSILDMLVNGQGAYTDSSTYRLLHQDNRLKKEYFQMEVDGKKEIFSRFFLPEKPVAEEEMDFYRFFWDEDGPDKDGMDGAHVYVQRRKSLSGENAERYPALCINQKPFCVDDGSIYILSPLSREAVANIKRDLSKGQKIDYEAFRQYAWGKRGEENQEYNMLIDWTLRKQVYKKYTRKDIEEAYESFMQSIYQITLP